MHLRNKFFDEGDVGINIHLEREFTIFMHNLYHESTIITSKVYEPIVNEITLSYHDVVLANNYEVDLLLKDHVTRNLY